MSIEDDKVIARQWEEVVLGQRKFDLLDEVIHPNYTLNDGEIRGREAARAMFTQWLTDAPSTQFTRLDMIAEGDKVVSRWISNDGNGQAKGISIYRIADGKIIEDWFCAEEIKPT
jgi:predicted SnoaL-like aldol condensation-catalyzing enzyme